MSSTITKKAITLKGSAQLVTDYLKFGINSILFQRGIYPPETFKSEEHFGLSVYMTTDEKIEAFLNSVLGQIKDWLLVEKIKKMSLVITNTTNKEVVERWDFNLEYEKPMNGCKEDAVGNKDIKTIQKEIRQVLTQIFSTVSILPLLDDLCTFDLLIHTIPDAEVPDQWAESAPVFIANSQELQLKSFSTSFHRMDTIVSYKVTN